jgi:hypothetical protein
MGGRAGGPGRVSNAVRHTALKFSKKV